MVGLGNFQVFMIVTSVFMTIAQIPYCTPGEELQPYNLTLSITQNSQNQIKWYNGGLVQIASCLGDVCDRPGVSVSGQTSTLMFANVTRQNATTYVCTSGKNSTCDLKVYARAKSVSCQQAVLQADTVTVVCTVTRIYPNPLCQFQWIVNATENHILQDNVITYVNLTGNGDPDYFNVNCSLKLPARNFSVGAHQFHVRVYPNVTGRESDKDYGIDSQTSPQTVVYPVLTLNCSETNVQEGKPIKCTCRDSANIFIFPTTTLFYGSVQVLQQVTGNVTANRDTEELTCKAQLPDGTNANNTYTIQVAFGPIIISFEANNSVNITVEKNSRVNFSCQAEGNPPPRLSLRKDGTALQEFNDPARKFNLTLNNQTLAGCKDTGVYMCLAETAQTTVIKTVFLYVKCTQQFRDPDSLSTSLIGQVNGTVNFNISVFGYPEPSLTLISTRHVLSSDVYSLTYIKQEPPYGTVSLMINIKNKSFFQNYSLMITNSQGQLTHSFEIVEGDHVSPASQEGQGLNVGSVVGGVVAGVLVVAAVVVVVIFLKRRGLLPNRGKKDGNADHMLNIRQTEKKEDDPETQAPESSHYEEIIATQSDMSDKPVYYTNQKLSNTRGGEVEYENTVCAL